MLSRPRHNRSSICPTFGGALILKTHTMNKVTNLPKRYSWEYMYKVDGAIFTLQQGTGPFDEKTWYLRGYESQEALDNYDPFLQESSKLKRHFTFFMKHTFTRQRWAI
jgi:hypothetical protein